MYCCYITKYSTIKVVQVNNAICFVMMLTTRVISFISSKFFGLIECHYIRPI